MTTCIVNVIDIGSWRLPWDQGSIHPFNARTDNRIRIRGCYISGRGAARLAGPDHVLQLARVTPDYGALVVLN